MAFADKLDLGRVPRRVGDVRLRYEPALLIGESVAVRARTWIPEVLGVGGIASALAAVVALLVAPTEAAAVTGALAVLAAAQIGAATVLAQRRRMSRRFVLNFATESLRLDQPSRTLGAATTEIVPFDSVRAVHVVELDGGGLELRVELLLAPGAPRTTRTLVADVREAEAETLQRLWKMLHDAFGLGRESLEGPIDSME